MTESTAPLSELMSHYGTDILHFVRFYSRSVSEAEDLTQEVFLRAFRQLYAYQNTGGMKAWLLRIAVNVCKDYFRWRKRHPLSYVDEVPERLGDRSPEAAYLEAESKAELVELVMGLPSKLKDTVLLYYFESLSIEEVAWTLNISESAVKTRLHRARLVLKGTGGGLADERV